MKSRSRGPEFDCSARDYTRSYSDYKTPNVYSFRIFHSGKKAEKKDSRILIFESCFIEFGSLSVTWCCHQQQEGSFWEVRMCVSMNTDGLACWWLRWVLKPPPPSSLWSLILSLCSRLWTESRHTLKIVLLLCIPGQLMMIAKQNRNTAMECKGWYWSVFMVYLYYCVFGRNQHKCIRNPFMDLCCQRAAVTPFTVQHYY